MPHTAEIHDKLLQLSDLLINMKQNQSTLLFSKFQGHLMVPVSSVLSIWIQTEEKYLKDCIYTAFALHAETAYHSM